VIIRRRRLFFGEELIIVIDLRGSAPTGRPARRRAA
jgi:hypothetical protein